MSKLPHGLRRRERGDGVTVDFERSDKALFELLLLERVLGNLV